jgi:glycyl-tRNA synthetase
MEMQFFVKPGTEMEWYDYWKKVRLAWHNSLGLGKEKYRYHDHLKLAHYANAACDIEFEFPFGFKELEGIHSRTDFDLKQHEQYSGKKLQYFDTEENKSYVPYVVETSVGLDRLFLSILSAAYKEEKVDNDTRVVLSIPPALAPIKAAVLPLVKKGGLPELAQEIMKELQLDYIVDYDEKDTVGRRYRRQDAIGTPYCFTVDHQSLEDKTVTIRDRDSMKQERIPISNIAKVLDEKVNIKSLLKTLL